MAVLMRTPGRDVALQWTASVLPNHRDLLTLQAHSHLGGLVPLFAPVERLAKH